MKKNHLNFNKVQLTLSKEEGQLLKIALEEYNELFPRILEIKNPMFIQILEKYLKITLVPKNIILKSNSLNKILQIIKDKYYKIEYNKITKIIQSIINISNCEIYNGNNFIPHCNNHCEPIHSCGNKMYILDNSKYLLCLKCQKIYHSNFILFYCSHCKSDYYTLLKPKDKEEIYKPATWEKYHCNAIIDDLMKCPKCKSVLYINSKNEFLICLKCNLELKNNIIWKCILCDKEFYSNPKEYNPNETKLMKIIIKETIFNRKDAKPEFIPCCNFSKSEILNYKFTHKKECNGNLYEGEFNKRKIIVCEKCHMLNFYENHKWMCPKCKIRFSLNKKEDLNEKNNTNNNDINENDININNNNNNIINRNNSKEKEEMEDKEEEIFYKKVFNYERKLNNIPRKNTPFGVIKKKLSETNLSQLRKFGLEELISSASRILGRNRISSSSNVRKNFRENHSCHELEKQNDQIFNDYYNKSINEDFIPKKLSNININLNVNVNINNNHIKIPRPPKIPNSKINILKKELYNQVKNQSNIIENNKFSSDDYNIISQIGEGTFGKIYQVEGLNKKQYAMKKILANSEEDIKTLESEYKMLNDLSPYNLNLVKIYGIETKKLDKTTYVMYVLMDLAIHDWEKEIIKRSKYKEYYSENELIQILKELIHTFASLQKHNISHRDIKPQNILLFKNNSFKIADFGEAKALISNNNPTAKQTIRGTELYMSPILFKAIKANNFSKYTKHNPFKSDVYSLGLCLLFAATLTFNSLCDIRDLNNSISLKLTLEKYLRRYSRKFTDFLYSMLEIDEKCREDFIELDKRIEYL